MALESAKKKLGGLRKQQESEEKAAPPNSKLAIQRSFGKATRELSKMLRGDDAIYRIPWIAVVGEPGCDKERLLPGSGLSPRQGSPSTFGLEGESAKVCGLRCHTFRRLTRFHRRQPPFTGSASRIPRGRQGEARNRHRHSARS